MTDNMLSVNICIYGNRNLTVVSYQLLFLVLKILLLYFFQLTPKNGSPLALGPIHGDIDKWSSLRLCLSVRGMSIT